MEKFRDFKGFTLLEFVVVVALAAALIGMTALLITRGRTAANFSTTNERIRAISAGLSEARMYKNSLPLQNTLSTTWPAALDSYIEADFRSGGAYEHGYQCSSDTVTLQTPDFESEAIATSIMTKLKDQNVCGTASALDSTKVKINCVVTSLAGTARCN
ncbi:MAG: prepilin-type N-terminal cleavage/methylation domain-containing protein [Syntrophorhabdaceae bacterium]